MVRKIDADKMVAVRASRAEPSSRENNTIMVNPFKGRFTRTNKVRSRLSRLTLCASAAPSAFPPPGPSPQRTITSEVSPERLLDGARAAATAMPPSGPMSFRLMSS